MNQNDFMRFLMANGLTPPPNRGALEQRAPQGILSRATQALNEPFDMEGRLTFLPAKVTPQGKELALPGILASAWNAFTAPGRAYSGGLGDPMSEAMNVAGMMNLGAMPSPAVGGPGTLGMNVYHGSPHKFDKFDMSKVGTGEGAQAYGHGLYFAENPGVARSYQSSLSNPYSSPETAAKTYLADSGGDVAKAIAKMADHARGGLGYSASDMQNIRGGLQLLKKGADVSKAPSAGALYKVDLPDDQIAKMLDWDKPLSQQPEAMKVLNGLVPMLDKDSAALLKADAGKMTGAGLLTYARRALGNDAKASQYLAQQGIPGIRYLDGGSRSGGKGTSNFVVFDDKVPQIIGRE